MCLARSTPHTGSSGAQGLRSEYTAKPQVSRTQRGYGPKSSSLSAALGNQPHHLDFSPFHPNKKRPPPHPQ